MKIINLGKKLCFFLNITRPNWDLDRPQFCVCILLDSRDKSLKMFQMVSGFLDSAYKISVDSAYNYLQRKFCGHIDFVADSSTSVNR